MISWKGWRWEVILKEGLVYFGKGNEEVEEIVLILSGNYSEVA